MSADELSRAVNLLARQVGHWEAGRWAAPAAAGNATRGDLMHLLVQRIADLAADAEGEPRRLVPRLDNELALVDQLRVVSADLIAAGASQPTLTAAAAQVTTTRQAL